MHEPFLDQAEARPDAVAIVDGDRKVTYGELAGTVLRTAAVLRELGVGRGDRVAIWLEKSIEAVSAMLASSCAGGVYVPLDPGSPPARAAKILRSCEPAVVLVGPRTAGAWRECAAAAGAARVAWGGAEGEPPAGLEAVPLRAAAASAAPEPPAAVAGDAPAHILFTSGSTGQPKGVVITHANVLAFVAWANSYFDVRPGDRHSGHSPLFFDLSTYDIYGSLSAGAELHLVPPRLNLLPGKLAEFIRERRLTQWFSVPSILNYLAKFDAVGEGDFPEMKRLMWCGEVFPTPSLRYFMARLPHVRFTNLYGPTEATIASSYYTVPAVPASDREEIPIGSPCGGEELFVVGEDGRVLPPGRTGELWIAGVGVAAGYWRDPERTAQAFVPHPQRPGERAYRTGDLARQGEDGLFYYLGRSDSQIKSRGYRIELGEIEAALAAVPWLREAAVVAVPTDGFEGWSICCAYVPQRGREAPPREIKAALARDLPAYMIPHRFRAWDALPRTPNGKVDRKAIRAAFAAADAG
ncbi:MAG: D-alanine--poly(phosphoribitol) ligase [Acidobacteria bacterium]|nr:MAG: D-alanine--poly(phosphoribitol) ligase [Acidobacteriota bacterium]